MPDADHEARAIHVVHLYPREMSIYGDLGNTRVLASRLRWHGYDAGRPPAPPGRGPFPDDAHLLLGGGGQDSGQVRVEDDLAHDADALRSLAEDGDADADDLRHVPAVRATRSSRSRAGACPGLGILDVTTQGNAKRMIGPVVARHRVRRRRRATRTTPGSTTLGAGQQPFGRVRSGLGNNGSDQTEGAVTGAVFGSYLHGPILPANPAFADALIALAVRRATGRDVRAGRAWTTRRRRGAAAPGTPARRLTPLVGRAHRGWRGPVAERLARCGRRGRRWRRRAEAVRWRRAGPGWPRCGGRLRGACATGPTPASPIARAASPSGGCRPRTARPRPARRPVRRPRPRARAAVPDSVTPTPPGVMPTAVSSRPDGVGGEDLPEAHVHADRVQAEPEQHVVDAEEADQPERHADPPVPDDVGDPGPQVAHEVVDADARAGPRAAPERPQHPVETSGRRQVAARSETMTDTNAPQSTPTRAPAMPPRMTALGRGRPASRRAGRRWR